MSGRVTGEQSARDKRAQSEQPCDKSSPASTQKLPVELRSRRKTSAWKARFELADNDRPRHATRLTPEAKLHPIALCLTCVEDRSAEVESRRPFTAAAASALGGRSNAQEQTARNTAQANKILRVIADKRGIQWS